MIISECFSLRNVGLLQVELLNDRLTTRAAVFVSVLQYVDVTLHRRIVTGPSISRATIVMEIDKRIKVIVLGCSFTSIFITRATLFMEIL